MTEYQLCDFVNFCTNKSKTGNRRARARVETFLFKGNFKTFMIKD